ncbi:double-cubane-cluster-containing anaerobic reductase [Desulfosarcina ovata]|uniref:3-hydroxyacyl-ACP dehydratase n=1 Tax=Desulfosarcina ovata subsp. ovata TaxID=2752305 RepID=A0A5K8A9D1_9BACT|nr:double-cubane-cluster-containing anaerobic reductase [Desulfosarcina ovata]BBO89175.1 3-hydroxyacyl-ACP dehydratase [Desulfosarcina ovata subsp. ovata]
MYRESIEKEPEQSERRKARFVRGLAHSAQAALTELEGGSDLPQGMAYFITIIKQLFVKGQLSPHVIPPGGKVAGHKKIIGTYCVMVPEELIYAAGAIPVRLCGGSFEASCLGDECVPRDTCPVVKASLGFTALNLIPLYEACDVVITPTTCDAKRKMGEELSKFTEVWMLEVPHVKESEGARRQWLEQIFTLKKNIEKLTSPRFGRKKIGHKALDAAIKTVGRAQHQARRLYEIRKSSPPVVLGREAMLAVNAYSYDAVAQWTHAMTELNDELETRRQKGMSVCRADAPRVLLAGSPPIFPNWKIVFLLEEMGAVIAADESCMSTRYLYDPVGITERSMTDMMVGLASRYLMPCVCPSFAPNEDRLIRLVQMVEEFHIDGIVYHVLKGCVNYDFELIRVENIMKERNIPVLRVETDYSPEDVEQIRTRVEAFTEMLRTKKRKMKRG